MSYWSSSRLMAKLRRKVLWNSNWGSECEIYLCYPYASFVRRGPENDLASEATRMDTRRYVLRITLLVGAPEERASQERFRPRATASFSSP